jgi:cytochrome c biogenesis protein CcmG/thiol:disulfide interchange protein DsbE
MPSTYKSPSLKTKLINDYMNQISTQKKSYRKHLIISLVFLGSVSAFVLLLARGLNFDQKKVPSELVGKTAFDFRAAWIQGESNLPGAPADSFSLRHFQGHPVVLNFWASWCVSCREEAQELERFWQKHRGERIFVVGVAIQDTKPAALEFAKQYGKTYILGLDTDGKIAIDYGVTGVPETFIIDRNGKILHKEVGPVTVDMLDALLPAGT